MFFPKNFNAEVAIILKMLDRATSNHDGWGLATFPRNNEFTLTGKIKFGQKCCRCRKELSYGIYCSVEKNSAISSFPNLI